MKSQAYGRREETGAIFLAAATSADAYASARMKGHPVITLVVGQAISGGFLPTVTRPTVSLRLTTAMS